MLNPLVSMLPTWCTTYYGPFKSTVTMGHISHVEPLSFKVTMIDYLMAKPPPPPEAARTDQLALPLVKLCLGLKNFDQIGPIT